MLTDELRDVLMRGPHAFQKAQGFIRYGGAASVRVQWFKYRDELMAASPNGSRPWGFWMIERRLKSMPPGPIGQMKAIRTLNLFRSERERRFVLAHLSEFAAKELYIRRQRPARAVA